MSIERVKAYKKRDYRGLVGKVLVSVIFIFFVLSCHFHIWSGAYQEGDLESAAVHSQEILADSMYGSGGTEELKEFLSLAYLAFLLAACPGRYMKGDRFSVSGVTDFGRY